MNPYFLMCDDLERAAQNREIISKKLYIWAYLQIEAWLAGNPTSELPYWIYSEGFINDRAERRKQRGIQRASKLTDVRRGEIASSGGRARSRKLSAKRRRAIARKAAKKRWMLA